METEGRLTKHRSSVSSEQMEGKVAAPPRFQTYAVQRLNMQMTNKFISNRTSVAESTDCGENKERLSTIYKRRTSAAYRSGAHEDAGSRLLPHDNLGCFESGEHLHGHIWDTTDMYFLVFVALDTCTGYYKKGELQRKRKQVIMHYLKRWMLPNLFILIFDWLAIFFQFAESSNAESSALLQFKALCDLH
eukprot:6472361-Amphidinium_carterae.2